MSDNSPKKTCVGKMSYRTYELTDNAPAVLSSIQHTPIPVIRSLTISQSRLDLETHRADGVRESPANLTALQQNDSERARLTSPT